MSTSLYECEYFQSIEYQQIHDRIIYTTLLISEPILKNRRITIKITWSYLLPNLYNMAKNKLFGLIILALSVNTSYAQEFSTENIYWPGNFEQALYGGNFSKAQKVEINDKANFTEGGKYAWNLRPSEYTHLELLTAGTGKYMVSFMGKASTEVEMAIKIVYKNDEGKDSTTDLPLKFKPDNQWHKYETELEVSAPYPGPRTGEILISCYNGTLQDAFIDNLELKRVGPDTMPEKKYKLKTTKLIKNGNFNKGCASWKDLSTSTNIIDCKLNNGSIVLNPNELASIYQVLDAKQLAGKTVQISADVAFESITTDAYSWAGIVISLFNGENKEADIIACEDKIQWCPMGHSAPPGEFKTITALYNIPVNTEQLFLKIEAQERINQNNVWIDNVQMHVIKE
ncbi:MAG: hypothetical protein ACERKD_07460 [Prolixibacteraceae bacterium]